MRKQFNFNIVASMFLVFILLAGCQQNRNEIEILKETNKLKIVATNSIIADMCQQIVGDNAEVYSIVPAGIDPHEYEPLPKDIQAVSDADIIFYNGLNLETGGNGWFNKLMESIDKVEDKDYFAVSKNIEPIYLTSRGSETDPHAWLDIQNGIRYTQNICQAISANDRIHQEIYTSNTENYIKELEKLNAEGKSKFADIQTNKKKLVSSEGAFKYFSRAYDLKVIYIWEINTENQGTPEQMSRIVDTIRESDVSALFVETSVDTRSMEQVSKETGIPIYAKIFTDSLAKQGEIGDTYYTMMKWNLEKIHEGLSQ